MDRRRAALDGSPDLPTRAFGAALFADLSGFTPLTDALVRELGPRRGAEALSFHIGQRYDALVACVQGHRGSVVTYVGDAMVCWFDARGGEVESAVASALNAAMGMQEAMGRSGPVETEAGTAVQIKVKVGVAAGAAQRFLLGDADRGLFDVLAGATVDRIVEADGLAGPGEVLVSEEALASVGLDVKEWRTATGRRTRFGVLDGFASARLEPWDVALDDLPEGRLRGWLPSGVFERLRAGGAFVSELRSATPLFVRFEGLDYERDEVAGKNLGELVDYVQEILQPFGGTLLQVIAGDKGSHLYIPFGAPLAHDDDSQRAVAAALELRGLAERFSFLDSTHLGLARGRVFAGTLGAPARLSYAVIGGTVNLAARLMGRAGAGEILVTGELAGHVAPRFAFENAGTATLKGKVEPVRVYAVKGVTTDRERSRAEPGVVVGRVNELTALTQGFDVVRTGGFRLSVIEGEAGIGKSHLMATVARRARESGLAVASGWGDAIENQRGYHAWRSVLQPWFGIEPGDDSTTRTDKALERLRSLDPELVDRAPLLDPALEAGMQDTLLTSQMSEEARGRSTVLLLTRLITEMASGQPLVLLLEDAHWFDSPSLAVLQQLHRAEPPLYIVVATRPLAAGATAASASVLEQLVTDSRTERLTLKPLSPEEVLELAARSVGVTELPPEVAALVASRAEGHPLFAREMVRALRDSGALTIDESGAAAAAGIGETGFEFPDTIEGVVTSRVDRLTPEQQLVVKVASVIGRTFTVETLQALLPDQADPSEHVDAVVRRGLATLDRPGDDPEYSFSHAIIQQVVYEGLLYAQRRELHRTLASRYESVYSGDLAPHYPLLADHWERAEDVPAALHYLEAAGTEAVAGFANVEAIAFIARASRLWSENPSALDDDERPPKLIQAQWRRLTAQARNRIGDFDQSYDDLRAGLELLGVPERRPPMVVFSLLLELLRQEFHRRGRVGLFTRERDAVVAMERARIYRELEYTYYTRGMALTGLYTGVLMLNLVERYGRFEPVKGLLAQGMTNLAGGWGVILRNRKVCDHYLFTAREHARADGDAQALAYSFLVEGIVRQLNARLDESREALDQALPLFDELGEQRRIHDTLYHMATLALFEGRLDECRGYVVETLAGSRTRDDLEHQLLALSTIALCDTHRGRYEEALEFTREALSIAMEGELTGERLYAMGVHALACSRLGDREGVRETLRRAAPAVAALGSSNVAMEAFPSILEAIFTGEEAAPGSEPQLMELAKPVLRVLKKNARTTSRVHVPRAGLYTAWLDALNGRHRRAERILRKVIDGARDAGVPYEEARAQLELARLLPPDDPARKGLLHDAESTFERLDFSWELARARTTVAKGVSV